MAAIENEGLRPGRDYDLKALKAVLSTGSPLSIESFRYVYREIKEDVCLSSISGGSDLVGCFAGGNPIGPVYAGQLQVRNLGMAIEAWDAEGNSVEGEKGELVCDQALAFHANHVLERCGRLQVSQRLFPQISQYLVSRRFLRSDHRGRRGDLRPQRRHP
jgi:acyl-coenzyme A synthetase/AMP-(fatty) acid ligase